MSKIGRNKPCPCGSGKKYKRCHGALQPMPNSNFVPPHILKEAMQALAIKEAERKRFEATHGNVKEIISATLGNTRFVATGSKLNFAEKWKVFPDFLGPYLAGCLGKEWGDKQVKLPVQAQHPVVQWHTYFAIAQQGTKPNDQGLYSSSVGAGNAWFRLAYDLYLIEHNAALRKRLIKRLRHQDHFQGARFEVAVAAMMLASGYELKFADEKGPGKHPEFYATHRQTGQILAVEAKSKHRSGVLGFELGSLPEPPTNINIDGLLCNAVEKNTQLPLLVFIELNLPTVINSVTADEIYREVNTAWTKVQERSWKSGFPSIGVVFYNDIAPWYLCEPLPVGNSVWALVLWPQSSRHSFDAKPLLQKIAQGCIQRCNIPLEFPNKQ